VNDESIQKFLDVSDDPEQVRDLFHSTTPEEASEVISRALARPLLRNVFAATTVLREMASGHVFDEERTAAFCAQIQSGEILGRLASLTDAESYGVRYDAITTLGRLCMPGSDVIFKKAFARSIPNDPLLIPAILREWFWNDPKSIWNFVSDAIRETLFLSRWSLLEFLQHSIPWSAECEKRRCKLLSELSSDESAYISNEAKYHVNVSGCTTRAGSERGSSQRHSRPKFTFEGLTNRFLLKLDRDANYSVEELTAFLDGWVQT
jgi:hypothetical protein